MSAWHLTFADHQLHLDPATGLPVAVVRSGRHIGLAVDLEAQLGGDEVRGALGGLDHPGQRPYTQVSATEEPVATDGGWQVAATLDRWNVTWEYTPPAGDQAGWQWSAILAAATPGDPLRSLRLNVRLDLDHLDHWRIQVPGGAIRRGVRVAELPEVLSIASITGVDGSAAVVVAEHADESTSVVLHPNSVDELSRIELRPTAGGVNLSLLTGLATAGESPEPLPLRIMRLGVHQASWAQLRPRVPGWLADDGIMMPTDHLDWVDSANLFEAQIGESYFGDWTYGPYVDLAALINDLDRIKDLGFTCVQVMPRQPYPSYNVHDWADLDVSYGSSEDLKRLVEEAHARDMRVILDVLLHGVIDAEVIHEAADAVRAGPYAERLDDPDQGMGFADADPDSYSIAWSRHIIDFEDAWASGSPRQHPWWNEHREWFCTRSDGAPIGVYTKAFNLANPEWQAYFSDAMANLITQTGIDGFRFDAPTYNEFTSWSPDTRHRAGAHTVAAIGLFADLRARFAAEFDPQPMFYTEPSGPALRQSMDLNYNYDEQWLVRSLESDKPHERPWGVSNARHLREWFADRDACLPPGRTATAHHIDSHDTFWWPLAGRKWVRDRMGLPAAQALFAIWALSGGAFMNFIGGEQGIEDLMRQVLHLRHEHPAFVANQVDFEVVDVDADTVFAARHGAGDGPQAIAVVNFADQPVACSVASPGWTGSVRDLLDPQAGDLELSAVELAAYQARIIEPSA